MHSTDQPQPYTGSFPLMNLAKRYGVDYGDVLLVAGSNRAMYAGEEPSDATEDLVTDAMSRIYTAAVDNQGWVVLRTIGELSMARWSIPEAPGIWISYAPCPHCSADRGEAHAKWCPYTKVKA